MASVVWKMLPLRNPCKFCAKFHRPSQDVFARHARRMSKKASSKSDWQSVVGLEIHAQINTASKLFSGASTKFGAPINSQVAPFDAALPGTLPVLNKDCVEAGVLTALALGCRINQVSKFDRKHYFYADLPAGYQITQQRQPLACDGQVNYVHVTSGAGQTSTAEMRTCRLIQLQLEQDSGKSLHDHLDKQSLIDLNRAGVGLMEVVTQPDLRDGEDAASFVKEVQLLLRTIGTCDGKMQEGSLRVDANISIHKAGEPWGVRTEVKNINSVRNVSKAIDFEIQRQIGVLENGGQIEKETRSFDAESNETVQMRDKEKLLDYRFMPEPNLPPLHVYSSGNVPPGTGAGSNVVLETVQRRLPDLPGTIRDKLQHKYDVPLLSATLLVTEEGLLDIFESLMADGSRDLKTLLNVLLNDYIGVLHEHDCTAAECPIRVQSLGEVCDLLASRDISQSTLQKLLPLLFEHPEVGAVEMVDRENWRQIRDRELIEKVINEVLSNPKVMKKLQKGGARGLNAVMGPVQQALDRRADPQIVTEIVENIYKNLSK
ncbi:glutamyl-tRNA(Gln) amidotransferase subunit B, mitochondrial-like isoform X2 [Littorina saxatilis]|uniref:glutamyl-tRNA(Gln) amidotransferase subunit B, mitochondrial-like isoform X2 n=1 Tax=Littorina saxatilis TaxID=31220 RepID=UPI0038B4C63F